MIETDALFAFELDMGAGLRARNSAGILRGRLLSAVLAVGADRLLLLPEK